MTFNILFSRLKFAPVLAIVLVLSFTTRAENAKAELCTIDAVPAATLLIPYFAVDLDMCDEEAGLNTVVRILNADAAPTLANVIFWTDWSIPTHSFDVSLAGYSLVELDLKEIFCSGSLPSFQSNSQDLDSSTLEHVQAWHTGAMSPKTGNCAAEPRSDQTLVGYLTVDNVTEANLGFPTSNSDYFTKISNKNQLTGHVYLETFEAVEEVTVESVPTEPPFEKQKCKKLKKGKSAKQKCKVRNKLLKQLGELEPKVSITRTDNLKSQGLHGFPAVHIEADDSFTGGSSNVTFYGRYTTGGADNREPLPTSFSAQFSQADSNADYELVVWREGDASAAPLACGATPIWRPLKNTQLVAFDDEGEATEIFTEIPLETQVTKGILSTVADTSGWLFLNLNEPTVMGLRQSWVAQRRNGKYGEEGVSQMSSGCG